MSNQSIKSIKPSEAKQIYSFASAWVNPSGSMRVVVSRSFPRMIELEANSILTIFPNTKRPGIADPDYRIAFSVTKEEHKALSDEEEAIKVKMFGKAVKTA